jgi:hypothetical protein
MSCGAITRRILRCALASAVLSLGLGDPPGAAAQAVRASPAAHVASEPDDAFHGPAWPDGVPVVVPDGPFDGICGAAGGPVLSIVGPHVNADLYHAAEHGCDPCWTWQVLPDGLIYRSYLAGTKEPRLSGTFFHEKDAGWLLDVGFGGRVGMLRLGTTDDGWPRGWQVDLEGAAFPRLNLQHNWDMESADFRFGVPLTYGTSRVQAKLAYYHLSSHLGDELILRTGRSAASRINVSRDALVLGVSVVPRPAWRCYGEMGWAFASDGGSEPWEFQCGVQFSPPGASHVVGTPFLAVNAHLREESDFGGTLVVQTGWQCRGRSGHLFRVGLHYLNGKSNQFQFLDEDEQQIGLGIWYDY